MLDDDNSNENNIGNYSNYYEQYVQIDCVEFELTQDLSLTPGRTRLEKKQKKDLIKIYRVDSTILWTISLPRCELFSELLD